MTTLLHQLRKSLPSAGAIGPSTDVESLSSDDVSPPDEKPYVSEPYPVLLIFLKPKGLNEKIVKTAILTTVCFFILIVSDPPELIASRKRLGAICTRVGYTPAPLVVCKPIDYKGTLTASTPHLQSHIRGVFARRPRPFTSGRHLRQH